MKDEKKYEETIEQIKQQIELLLNDNSVPRNVKNALDEAEKAAFKRRRQLLSEGIIGNL